MLHVLGRRRSHETSQYKTVTIGTKTTFTKNLGVSHFEALPTRFPRTASCAWSGHRLGHKKVSYRLERGRLGGETGQKVAGQEHRDPQLPTPWTVPVSLRGLGERPRSAAGWPCGAITPCQEQPDGSWTSFWLVTGLKVLVRCIDVQAAITD